MPKDRKHSSSFHPKIVYHNEGGEYKKRDPLSRNAWLGTVLQELRLTLQVCYWDNEGVVRFPCRVTLILRQAWRVLEYVLYSFCYFKKRDSCRNHMSWRDDKREQAVVILIDSILAFLSRKEKKYHMFSFFAGRKRGPRNTNPFEKKCLNRWRSQTPFPCPEVTDVKTIMSLLIRFKMMMMMWLESDNNIHQKWH